MKPPNRALWPWWALTDQQRKVENQQKQIEELQRNATELQKRQTTTDGTHLPTVDLKTLPTTTEFRQKVVGMTKDDLVKRLGKPTFTADLGKSQRLFYYNDAARDPDSDRAVRACVTIENGKVTDVGFGS